MNNEELLREIAEQRKIIEKIYISTEKTRKYIFWTAVVTFVTFILPLIILTLALPYITSYYTSLINSATLGL